MTTKDKRLLIKDLCARLPYGIILQIGYGTGKGTVEYNDEVMGYATVNKINNKNNQ